MVATRTSSRGVTRSSDRSVVNFRSPRVAPPILSDQVAQPAIRDGFGPPVACRRSGTFAQAGPRGIQPPSAISSLARNNACHLISSGGDEHMGDSSQGPGWWQASDGRWYPPESHPTAQQPTMAVPPTVIAPPVEGAILGDQALDPKSREQLIALYRAFVRRVARTRPR